MPKPIAKTPSAGDSNVSSPPRAPELKPAPSPSEPIQPVPNEPAAETNKPDADSEMEDKSPDDAAPPPDADVLAGTPPEHPGCPDCQSKKAKRKGNGFPFGRKPLAEGEVPVTKRVLKRVIIRIDRGLWEGCKDRKGIEVTVFEVDPDPED